MSRHLFGLQAHLEETFKKIQKTKGVKGVLILNKDGSKVNFY